MKEEHIVPELPPAHLAAKLDRLFRSSAARRRGEFTYREVAAGVAALGQGPISATYVWQLRTGQRANPTMRHLEGLAAFFGVPASYFFDAEVTARLDAALELIVTLNDGALRRLALDAAGLSPDSLAAVSALVQQLRRVEGSPGLLAQATTSADEPARSRSRRAHGGQGRRTRTREAPPPA